MLVIHSLETEMRTICGSRVKLDNIFMTSQMQMCIYTFAENFTLWPLRFLFLDVVFFSGSVMVLCGKMLKVQTLS